MVNIEYANAYREVLEILKYVSIDDYKKIPKSKIEVFEVNSNKDYTFKYDPNKTLSEQKISKRAKAIIFLLFRDYWATPIQKEKIISRQNYYKCIIEEEKRKKYNPDNLFENKKPEIKMTKTENVVSVVPYKESFFTRIRKWFKNLIR